MFDGLLSIFKKKRAAAPVNSDFLKPKAEPVKKPVVMLSDRQAPLPAVMQDLPPAILLPGATRPMEDMKPLVQLPPDIDPNQVAVVRHDAKKADTERFKYSDKPLKPLRDDVRGAELIKYSDKHTGERIGDVMKYNATPATTRSESEGRKSEVFKYTPTRVVIKN